MSSASAAEGTLMFQNLHSWQNRPEVSQLAH